MRPPFVERLLPSFHDMPGSLEVWLPDLQVNNASPLSLQRPRSHKYFKRGLHRDSVHPRRELHAAF